VEALECPTMLLNGYGEHNIQGIGDKHIPLIHNVMNTDYVIAVSDRASDGLMQLFNSQVGRSYLARRSRIDPALIARLDGLGLSAIANVVAAIKLAKYLKAGPDSVFITVATDGAELYRSEQESYAARTFPDGFDEVNAAELYARYILAATPTIWSSSLVWTGSASSISATIPGLSSRAFLWTHSTAAVTRASGRA
jgi:cysteine synthase